jgi:release factor glutamine methyltransferase
MPVRPAETVLDLVRASTDFLQRKGVPSARLDAELLIGDAVGLDRLQLYVQFDRPATEPERDAARELIRRRGGREPVALILGEKEFRSRPFLVEPGVLIPRPDTELLVERALATLPEGADESPLVVDLGCGCGVLAVCLALESTTRVLAVDRSPDAVRVTRANVKRHGVEDRVGVVRGDWLFAVPERFAGAVDVIVSNPPYVPEDEYGTLAPEIVQFEPREAVCSAPDPLAYYRRTADGLARWLCPGGAVLVEVGRGQADAVAEIFAQAGVADVARSEDLAGIERVVAGTWPG